MIQPIMRDEAFLRLPSRQAGLMDVSIADDLMDTLKAHRAFCVGMAANMIGKNVRIIAFQNGENYMEMFNPRLIAASGEFQAQEGCLSLTGTRPARRFRVVQVEYQTRGFQTRRLTFSGWTAQIVQHEIDHLNGIII